MCTLQLQKGTVVISLLNLPKVYTSAGPAREAPSLQSKSLKTIFLYVAYEVQTKRS